METFGVVEVWEGDAVVIRTADRATADRVHGLVLKALETFAGFGTDYPIEDEDWENAALELFNFTVVTDFGSGICGVGITDNVGEFVERWSEDYGGHVGVHKVAHVSTDEADAYAAFIPKRAETYPDGPNTTAGNWVGHLVTEPWGIREALKAG